MILQAASSTPKLRAFTVLLVGSSAAMFAGCGGNKQAYDGPKVETSQVAIIKPYSPLTLHGHMGKNTHPISIEKIDGKDMGFSDKCTVLPGRHEVSVNLAVLGYPGYSGTEMDIVFDAKASHVYTVYGTRFGGGAVWIVDDTTKEVVAKEEIKKVKD